MKVKRGDIVLLDYPFSEAGGSKIRPALVVQTDVRNARLTETIVALVTTNLSHIGHDVTQFLIDIRTPDGRASGLRRDSAVRCGKLYTVHESHVQMKIGSLSMALMAKANDCLRAALELP